jgi:bifunctional polynucleotide phosphatase/kinase
MAAAEDESCLIHTPKAKFDLGITKIAGFDLDGTLVTSSRSKPFDTSPDHFVFFGDIPGYFQSLRQEWIVCIFTNQSRHSEENQRRIEKIIDHLEQVNGWSPYVLIATQHNDYRKPGIRMVTKLLEILNQEGYQITSGVYCGDACGPDDPFPPYRWSSSDFEFANNAGMSFVRPVEIFSQEFPPSSVQELVVLVGNQGSGKTRTAKMLETFGYFHVSRDELKTIPSMVRKIKEQLGQGRSVVVDATNPTISSRKVFLDLFHGADSKGDPSGVPLEPLREPEKRIAWHIRDGRPFNKLREKPIPEIAYRNYSKNFEEPSSQEAPVFKVFLKRNHGNRAYFSFTQDGLGNRSHSF